MQLQTANPHAFDLPWLAGPNDGVSRGDRADTGDEEAGPDDLGSGPAEPTIDPTSLGGETSIRHSEEDTFDFQSEREQTDGMEVMEATDGRLGLTGIPGSPAEDWAADAGPDKN